VFITGKLPSVQITFFTSIGGIEGTDAIDGMICLDCLVFLLLETFCFLITGSVDVVGDEIFISEKLLLSTTGSKIGNITSSSTIDSEENC